MTSFSSAVREKLVLVKPTFEYLPAYVAALEKGWSPSTVREETRNDELEEIRSDPQAFLRSLDDAEAKGRPVLLSDGTSVPRIPGFRRWMWDGEFAGSVGFRWKPGTAALPPHCLGHIGYSVVPWKRNRGYATAALALLLPEARRRGLPYVELVTDESNVPSQRVILANGGVLIETFRLGPEHGNGRASRFRISFSR